MEIKTLLMKSVTFIKNKYIHVNIIIKF